MSSVVFLRAVNVGGANQCRPAILARDLEQFDVFNIGAVGTFVVRKDVSESTLRAAIAKKLPFKCAIMICPGKQIIDISRENPLKGEPGADIQGHVTVLAKPPIKTVKLPVYVPSRDSWEIKIARVVGPVVICLRRRVANGRLYPNEVVEKYFGIPATTRNWNTIEKVAKILRDG
jgi:uncharacterized protein (DUF1697 family)